MRKRGRLDANHTEIVDALKAIGATVRSLVNMGDGCPDILVGFQGRNLLMEIKTHTGKLTADEMKFYNEWQGQYCIVRTIEQAIEAAQTNLDSRQGG